MHLLVGLGPWFMDNTVEMSIMEESVDQGHCKGEYCTPSLVLELNGIFPIPAISRTPMGLFHRCCFYGSMYQTPGHCNSMETRSVERQR